MNCCTCFSCELTLLKNLSRTLDWLSENSTEITDLDMMSLLSKPNSSGQTCNTSTGDQNPQSAFMVAVCMVAINLPYRLSRHGVIKISLIYVYTENSIILLEASIKSHPRMAWSLFIWSLVCSAAISPHNLIPRALGDFEADGLFLHVERRNVGFDHNETIQS